MAHPAARALKGHAFVASPSTKQPFRIVDEQVYAKLGGNETLKPTPAIVHFGGFNDLRECRYFSTHIMEDFGIEQLLNVPQGVTVH